MFTLFELLFMLVRGNQAAICLLTRKKSWPCNLFFYRHWTMERPPAKLEHGTRGLIALRRPAHGWPELRKKDHAIETDHGTVSREQSCFPAYLFIVQKIRREKELPLGRKHGPLDVQNRAET